MKVVKISEDWSLEVTCDGSYYNDGGCESVFIVNETDLIPRYVHDDLHFIWCCPHCGRINCIEESLIPKRIQYNCAYLYRENSNAWETMLSNSYLMKLENARRIKLLYQEYDKEPRDKETIKNLQYPKILLDKKKNS